MIAVRSATQGMNAHEGDAPRYHTGAWRAPFPAEGFGPLHEEVLYGKVTSGRPASSGVRSISARTLAATLARSASGKAAMRVADLTAIMNAHEGDAPRYHTGAWRAPFPAEGFGAPARSPPPSPAPPPARPR
jgi:hypothetical protein